MFIYKDKYHIADSKHGEDSEEDEYQWATIFLFSYYSQAVPVLQYLKTIKTNYFQRWKKKKNVYRKNAIQLTRHMIKKENWEEENRFS